MEDCVQLDKYCRPYYDAAERAQAVVYIQSLDAKQTQTLEIARQHLKTSFDILKSGGYIAFCARWHKIVRKWRTWAMLQMWRGRHKHWRTVILRYRYDMEDADADADADAQ